jgi:hypothetical protein
MLSKRILMFNQHEILACDGRCDKAWGINGRPRRELSDHPDDYVYIGDDDLGTAPSPDKTVVVSEGSHGKPSAVALIEADSERMNKWCARQCERSKLFKPHQLLLESSLPNLQHPLPNLELRRAGAPLCDPKSEFSVDVVGEPLQEWYNRVGSEWPYNHPEATGPKAFWEHTSTQMMFVRDRLRPILKAEAYVISTHRSKSCLLPVYQLVNREAGLMVVLRNNFYDWKMSVVSERPVVGEFFGLLEVNDKSATSHNSCYYEGFPEQLIFGFYDDNKKRWSSEIGLNEAMWTVLYLIAKHLGIR